MNDHLAMAIWQAIWLGVILALGFAFAGIGFLWLPFTIGYVIAGAAMNIFLA